MPKEIKGNAGRKPPEPSDNHSDIDAWFRRQMPHLFPAGRMDRDLGQQSGSKPAGHRRKNALQSGSFDCYGGGARLSIRAGDVEPPPI